MFKAELVCDFTCLFLYSRDMDVNCWLFVLLRKYFFVYIAALIKIFNVELICAYLYMYRSSVNI